MGKNNNIIEINGKRYDARTGVMLAHGASKIPTGKNTVPAKPLIKKPTMRDVVRQPAKSASPHKPKPSKTLMRSAVKKPSPPSKKSIKAQGPTELKIEPVLAEVVVSKSVKHLDTKKLAQAKKVPQSHLITHFSSTTSDLNSTTAALTSPPSNPSVKASEIVATPKKSKAQTTAELLEHAISQANSPKEPTPKPKKHRARKTRIALASLTAVILMAFVANQEMPNIKLSFASSKAGFSAALPNYNPAGYSMGKLSYSSGIVSAKFNSNSDQRSYTLTQKTSDWNSQSLKENFVINNSGDKYQAIETGGRTIYLYGDGNATWVNGGVWYIVQSNGALNNHQLVEVAKSI